MTTLTHRYIDQVVGRVAADQRDDVAAELEGLLADMVEERTAAGVPEAERGELLETLAALPRDVSILLIEHDMDLVFSFADRITVLVIRDPDGPDDIRVTKWRYSGFQRTDLRQLLAHHGRDQLIVIGVYAHMGCMISATEAFMSDVAPFFVVDADQHQAARGVQHQGLDHLHAPHLALRPLEAGQNLGRIAPRRPGGQADDAQGDGQAEDRPEQIEEVHADAAPDAYGGGARTRRFGGMFQRTWLTARLGIRDINHAGGKFCRSPSEGFACPSPTCRC